MRKELRIASHTTSSRSSYIGANEQAGLSPWHFMLGRKVRATESTLLPNRKALGFKAKRQLVPQKINRLAQ